MRAGHMDQRITFPRQELAAIPFEREVAVKSRWIEPGQKEGAGFHSKPSR
jgi:hypothetical protein